MAVNYGKKFEGKVLEDLKSSFPDSVTIRIPDQQSKYKGQSSNICDIVSFNEDRLFLVECKTTHDTTFNFARLTQYDDLLAYKDKKGVYPGVVIWFVELDLIIWVNIGEIEKMKLDGKKSVSPKSLELCDYKLYKVPAKKKRTFFKCDFSFLMSITKEV